MKLAVLPRSARRPKLRSRLALVAALLVAVAMVGGFFSHAPVAHASVAHAADVCPVARTLVNQQTGYVIDVDGEQQGAGWPNDQWYYDGSWSEGWIQRPVPGTNPLTGPVYLENLNSHLYLDVAGASKADGAPVIQWYFNGQANQQWYALEENSANLWVSVNSGLVLDVATSHAGAQVIQDSYHNWLSQEWTLGC